MGHNACIYRRVSKYFKSKFCISIVCFFIFLNGVRAKASVDRYDQVGGASHPYESYGPKPGGWGGSGSGSGSVYHYHVPLVGSQQGWGWGGGGGWAPQEKGHGHDILLWVLIGLLALAALGALLLPLFLIPLGLSLLALLMGGMMMMAAPMMMMMMMMMMPQQPQSRTELVGRALDTVGKMVTGDTEGALANILSTIEMDNYCPEEAICNLGQRLGEGAKFIENFPFLKGKPAEILRKPELNQFIHSFIAQVPHQVQQQLGNGKSSKRIVKAFTAGFSSHNCTRMENRCRNLQKLREKAKFQQANSNLTHVEEPKRLKLKVVEIPKESVQIEEGWRTTDNNLYPEENPKLDTLKSTDGTFPQIVKPSFSTPTVYM